MIRAPKTRDLMPSAKSHNPMPSAKFHSHMHSARPAPEKICYPKNHTERIAFEMHDNTKPPCQ